MLITKTAIVLIIITFIVSAQTTLSGSVNGMLLEKSGNPYIVAENITVSAGENLTIEAGCIFMFNPFTGINIEGNLAVKGTAESPVIFTTINNPEYNSQCTQPPDPFDWNGIHLKPRARNVYLSHFIIEYSVFGVKSQIDQVVIEYGTFRNNGQFHFTIDNVMQPVSSAIPFNYGTRELPMGNVKKVAVWQRPFAISTAIGGVACIGASGYCYYQKKEYKKKYDVAGTQLLRNSYFDRQETMLLYTTISGIAGGFLLTTGGVMFTIDSVNRKKRVVACSPLLGEYNGVMVTVRF